MFSSLLYSPLSVLLFALICVSAASSGSNTGASSTNQQTSTVSITGSVSTTAQGYMEDAIAAYRVVNSQLQTSLNVRATAKIVRNDLFLGVADFSVISQAVTTTDQASYPNAVSFPITVSAHVPVLNLPNLPPSAKFVIDGQTMCRILRGNITLWSDPAIRALNPNLSFGTPTAALPNEEIEVAMLGVSSFLSEVICRFCLKVDNAGWLASGIGISNQPRLPNPPGKVKKVFYPSNMNYIVSNVLDKPYTIGFATAQAAYPTTIQTAMMINAAGQKVVASIDSVSMTMLELGNGPVPPGLLAHDLTNPISPTAWPIVTAQYLMLDTQNTLSTCAAKKAMLTFWIWFYTEPVVASIGTAQNVAMLPTVYVSQNNLLATLRSSMYCSGSLLLTSDTSTALIEGSLAASFVLGLFSNFYRQVDTTYTFYLKSSVPELTTSRLLAGEIDIAVLNDAQLVDVQRAKLRSPLDLYPGVESAKLLPSFLVGVSPFFNLPNTVNTLYSTWTPTSSTLPPLYPLRLDVEMLAGIFTGTIQNWLSPQMTKYNPQLIQWFGAANITVTSAASVIQVVICCTNPNDSLTATNMLLSSLNRTSLFQSNLVYQPPSLTTPWTNIMANINKIGTSANGANFTMIESEFRLNWKVQTTPGSISYHLIQGAKFAATTDFELVKKVKGNTNQANNSMATSSMTPVPYLLADAGADTAAVSSFSSSSLEDNEDPFITVSKRPYRTIVTSNPKVNKRKSQKKVVDLAYARFQPMGTSLGDNLESVQPIPTSLSSCLATTLQAGSKTYMSSTFSLANGDGSTYSGTSGSYFDSLDDNCWPLTNLLFFSVPSDYSSASTSTNLIPKTSSKNGVMSNCPRAQNTLQFLTWVFSSPVLKNAATDKGVVRVADLSTNIQNDLLAQLETVTCDGPGNNILITLPIYWSGPANAITEAAYAISSVFFVIITITVFLLYLYRHRPVLRSSSVPFLGMVEIGQILSFMALIAWVSPSVSSNSCGAFAWFSQLGFTLTFGPLFAKTYRIYRIFNKKHLKIVKITNAHLSLLVCALVLYDILLLSIWQGISPFSPQRDEKLVGGRTHVITSCGVAQTSGLALIGILAATKACLIFLCSLMSFATRNVTSSFNESQQIGWAVYNCVFAALIVAAIIVFIGAIEDTLIIIVMIAILWINTGVWACIFVPKINALFKDTTNGAGADAVQSMHNVSTLNKETTQGFSFLSTTAMGIELLRSYVKALEMQLDKARARLSAFTSEQISAGVKTPNEPLSGKRSAPFPTLPGNPSQKSTNNTHPSSRRPQNQPGGHENNVQIPAGTATLFSARTTNTFNNQTATADATDDPPSASRSFLVRASSTQNQLSKQTSSPIVRGVQPAPVPSPSKKYLVSIPPINAAAAVAAAQTSSTTGHGSTGANSNSPNPAPRLAPKKNLPSSPLASNSSKPVNNVSNLSENVPSSSSVEMISSLDITQPASLNNSVLDHTNSSHVTESHVPSSRVTVMTLLSSPASVYPTENTVTASNPSAVTTIPDTLVCNVTSVSSFQANEQLSRSPSKLSPVAGPLSATTPTHVNNSNALEPTVVAATATTASTVAPVPGSAGATN